MKSSSTSLEGEVKKNRKNYSTDSFPMSLREIASIYSEGGLILNPDFQRIFRWGDEQKSKFIESILLKIPVPSIFLYQREDGKLEVVDGLQRISTWLSFLGELKNEQDEKLPALVLCDLKILKKLNGYSTNSKSTKVIPTALVEFAKLEKLQLQIIGNDSDPDAKFEIFRRINKSGSFLSSQELRNALFVMLDKSFYDWLCLLVKDSSYQDCIALSDRLIEERYDLELALKFLILFEFGWGKGGSVSDYIDEKSLEILKMSASRRTEFAELFQGSFHFISQVLGDAAFKRWSDGKSKGKFLESAFECVCLGVMYNYEKIDKATFKKKFKAKTVALWKSPEFLSISGSGSNAQSRIPKLIKFSNEYFK